MIFNNSSLAVATVIDSFLPKEFFAAPASAVWAHRGGLPRVAVLGGASDRFGTPELILASSVWDDNCRPNAGQGRSAGSGRVEASDNGLRIESRYVEALYNYHLALLTFKTAKVAPVSGL
jgi:hypothetical protein